MSAQFSEKPWTKMQQGNVTVIAGTREICRILDGDLPTSQKNASLLITAPNLYEILDKIAKMTDAYDDGHITSTDFADDVRDLMHESGFAALRKAADEVNRVDTDAQYVVIVSKKENSASYSGKPQSRMDVGHIGRGLAAAGDDYVMHTFATPERATAFIHDHGLTLKD